MSGKPSPNGAERLIGLLEDAHRLDVELKELAPMVEREKSARVERANAEHAIQALLSAMDVDRPGNWGHSARLSWLLQEMRRQVEAKK